MDEESFLNGRRQEANRELLELLQVQVEKYPSERFSQILRNAGFVEQREIADQVVWADDFNLEPWRVLKRVDEVCKQRERRSSSDDV